MYYNGVYHEFYQYNPDGAFDPNDSLMNMVWGHSVSTDLINWIGLEPAIEPDTPSDICGCWTGSATILFGEQPVIIYTGLIDRKANQVQNIALPKNRSDPYLREWAKVGNNPVIQHVIPGLNSSHFRDPTTGWIGPDGLWRIAVGAEVNGIGTALLYKSKDFMNWTRIARPLYSNNALNMWECLDFFAVLPGSNNGLDMSSQIPSGAKHVLKTPSKMTIGCGRGSIMVLSMLQNHSLTPNMAGESYGLGVTRQIVIQMILQKAGQESMTIWLDGDGKQLIQWPVEEIESLRINEINHQGLELKKGDLFEIKGIDTLQADVEIDFEPTSIDDAEPFDPSWLFDPRKHCREADASAHGGIGPFGLVILASDNMEEHTAVHFRVYKSQEKYMILMCSDLRRSSLRPGLYTPAYGGFFEFDLENERKISLRTLIDRSAVESFGSGGRICITARVYPVALVDDGTTHMYAFNNGSTTVRVPQLRAWSMKRAQVNVMKGGNVIDA
ncbi:unnamed protein product [Triticum turgidum subsp. durum]|uniref:Beta-fructofuranosidase n=1 Tax=Triticum turgidum subsp. durum TaxID=4567 RepID=A0A9R0XQD6_TRITD|nr:unnamed protein product [Triticum turgidum subsp. durum]